MMKHVRATSILLFVRLQRENRPGALELSSLGMMSTPGDSHDCALLTVIRDPDRKARSDRLLL